MPNLSARPATDRWQRHGTALTVALLLAVLWSLVLWFSSAQHRRLLAESERALDLMNRALTEQTAGVLRDAENDLRVLEAWIAERPADPLDDIALGRLLRRLDDGSARRLALLRLVTADGALYAPTAEEGPLRRVSGAGMSGPLLPVRDDDGAAVLGAPLETAPGRLALPMVLRLSRPAGRVVALMALVDLDRLMALH
jgi:hypothetical protein